MRIDLNADLGEGYGPYTFGDDTALLALVTSANVACGFHGGPTDAEDGTYNSDESGNPHHSPTPLVFHRTEARFDLGNSEPISQVSIGDSEVAEDKLPLGALPAARGDRTLLTN